MFSLKSAIAFLLLGLLAIATAVSVVITMRLNYLFVVSMVEDAEKKLLVGWGTVIADLWKACGLIFVPLLWRWKRHALAGAAAFVWTLCFVWAVATLLGSVAQERMATTGSRENLQANYREIEGQLIHLERQRAKLPATRTVAELEALLAAALARPIEIAGRIRTIDELSKACSRPERVTIDPCREVAELKVELASAAEAARIDARLAELRTRAALLREHGAILASDVQGEMIARVTRGVLSAKDAALGLPLLVTAVFEAIGALCPAIVFAAFEGARMPRKGSAASDASVAGTVVDFLDECTEPGDGRVAITLGNLYAAYQAWCNRSKRIPATIDVFGRTLDVERGRPEMRDRVRKFADRYYGIALITEQAKIT